MPGAGKSTAGRHLANALGMLGVSAPEQMSRDTAETTPETE